MRRWLWFIGLYMVGIAGIGAIAALIRLALT